MVRCAPIDVYPKGHVCSACRYKQVERIAAEEYERERVRAPPRGRTEITLSLSSRTRSTSSSHSPTPESVTRTHTTHGKHQHHASNTNFDLFVNGFHWTYFLHSERLK